MMWVSKYGPYQSLILEGGEGGSMHEAGRLQGKSAAKNCVWGVAPNHRMQGANVSQYSRLNSVVSPP